MRTLIQTSIISFLFLVSVYGQSFKQYQQSIAGYLAREDYYAAYHDLNIALSYNQETDSLHMLAGFAALKLNAFAQAARHYKFIVNKEIVQRHPLVEFYLGEALFRQGFYGEALIYYKSFQVNMEEDPEMRNRIETRIASIHWAKTQLKNKDPLIAVKRLDERVNSPQNEFNPVFANGELYISSQNVLEPKQKGEEVQRNSGTILKYDEDKLQVLEVDNDFIEKGVHMVHPSFSPDGTKVYFSICSYEKGIDRLHCQIYVKFKNDQGTWGPRIKLPEPVNLSKYSSTQPHASIDPETGLDKLYFVSNRPGGKGGFDLYSTLISSGEFPSMAENLEYINTSDNEVSPHFNRKSQALYFSSEGHIGFGGYDVYRYAYRGKEANQVINLGPSINSSYDDLYYKEDDGRRKGYLVSNKPASKFLDESLQACCYDIYKIKFTPATLNLLVRTLDRYDSSALFGVRLQIEDITEGDSAVYSGQQDGGADYPTKVVVERRYRIIGSKPGWMPDTTFCNTVDLENLEDITRQLYLTELKNLNAQTFERTTNAILKGATVELWDLDADTLMAKVTNADTNDFNFVFPKGKNLGLRAHKPKYESAEFLISPMETALEPVLKRNLYLELTAIAELRKLLPIRLFFENDMPDPRSESDSTSVGFLDIYKDYYSRKATYISEFTRGLRATARDKAMREIDTFFEQSVKSNAEKLVVFMEKLIIILEEGHEIDIFLKGYASPRAKSDYNQLLSSRRVTSVRNEFDRYSGKGLHDYITGGEFQIKEIPFGESKASSDVSDDLLDTRNSVYSLKAAYERRVEILEILKGVDENVNQ
ncbi:MAG: PD40 domain-containing protein [Saprospiraceae bacterium]|nr:PD40 domain-containing protein [Saprospiraceae bacterium]